MKLSAVSKEAAELLRIVSLSPDKFSIALLEGMTGRDRVDLARRLDECIKAGLIEEINDGSGKISFRFTHGASRDYVSGDLPESLRETYHRRMAAYFEGFYRNGRKDLLTAVAYHYSRSHDTENAASYALLAAQQAFSRGANRDAIYWYNIYLNRIPDSTDDAEHFQVFVNLGSLYSITGEVDKADGLLKTALRLASDPKGLASVHYRLGRNSLNRSLYPETLDYYSKTVSICNRGDLSDPRLLRIMLETLIETSFVHRLQGHYDKAFDCLDKAGELMEGVDSVPDDIRALHYTRKADAISELGSGEEALKLYEKALAIYESIDDLPGQGTVLNNMHGIYSSRGDFEKSLSTMEEVIKINMNLDDRLGLAIGYFNIAEYYQEINMLEMSREYYGKYMELSDLIMNELGIGYGKFGLGKVHWLEGELEKARYCFEGALDVFSKLSVNQMKTECDLMIAQIFIYLEEFEEARKIISSIDEDTMNPSVELSTRFMKGLVMLKDPDADDSMIESALELFRKVIESAAKQSEVEISMHYAALVSACGKLGRDEEMKNALREGATALAEKLGRIPSYSIRNSMMTRREIVEFTGLCRSEGLPFPPEGFVFGQAE